MADALKKGSLFPPHLVNEVINMVKGQSSVAELAAATPIPFNGIKEFTFSMDGEIAIVAESGTKPANEIHLTPRTIVPFKVMYQSRVTDEFLYSSAEEQISIMQHYNEGYARKLARGIDLMAYHGVNPNTGTISTVFGGNYFDAAVTQTVTASSDTTADAQVEAAIALVQGSGYEVGGMAMSPTFRSALAAMTLTSGERAFPDLAWGNGPSSINGLPVRINKTVSDCPVTANGKVSTDLAILGDFRSAFRWGYARQIPMEIIQFGDPDQSGRDLKAHNEICIRCEAYLGLAVLDPTAFAIIKSVADAS